MRREVAGIRWVQWNVEEPTFASKRERKRGRRRQGVKYEAKCHEYLLERFDELYIPSPWLKFQTDEGKLQWAQPDGVLWHPRLERLTLIEVKYNHTPEAWWQMERLYAPLLAHLFPGLPIAFVELVKWYDPLTAVPAPVALLKHLDRAKRGVMNVHIWKP